MDTEKHKILIIDDDNSNIFALSAVLKSRGYKCLAAESVEKAIAVLSKHKVDIVLIDMMLPDVDGYEGITQIKSYLDGNLVPVIAVTAQAMTGDKERCMQAGADDYVSKPVNIDTLTVILNKFLNE